MSDFREKVSNLSKETKQPIIGLSALAVILPAGFAAHDTLQKSLPEFFNQSAAIATQKKACNRAAQANEKTAELRNDASYDGITFEGQGFFIPTSTETGEPINCGALDIDLGLER